MKGHFTRLTSLLLVLLFGIASIPSFGQLVSSNTIKYQLTYDANTSRYTVWVVPDYSTPNANNPLSSEFGATAQVTIRVPIDFTIQNITDINGSWEKSPLKLGDPTTQPAFASQTYDKSYRYYTIGKSSNETNYGPFAAGTPVPLFSFTGNFCAGAISLLGPNDPYITAARNAYNLNVRNSFYSRSGQPAGGNIQPREQFIDVFGPAASCPPVAVNDVSAPVNPGGTASINLLSNDLLSNSLTPLPGQVTVDLNPNVAGVQTTLTVAGQGTWTYDPGTGTLTFTPVPGFTTNPTPITYTLTEISTGLTATATISASYNQIAPNATDDNVPAVNPGQAATFNLLTNDVISDNSPATTANTTVDLNPAVAGIQTTFTVAGQGTWTYNAATGQITFTPIAGFTTAPTPLNYRLIENATNLFDDAVVTVNYNQVPPTAVNDTAPSAASGTASSVNLLTNDQLSDGSPATLGKVTIDIDPFTAGTQTTYTVAGQGTWTYNAGTGIVTFTPVPGYTIAPSPLNYTLTENATGLSSNATVTAPYTLSPPNANNDTPPAAQPGTTVTINLLANDVLSDNSPALTTNTTVDLDPATPGTQFVFTVPNQGTWTYDPTTGVLTFAPIPGFVTAPTPLTYTLVEDLTGQSDNAQVTVTYNVVPPTAVNDVTNAVNPGTLASVNLLTNDKLSDGSPATLNRVTIDIDPGVAGIQNTFVVAGQGTWTYYPETGLVTFMPVPGFTSDPTPLNYILIENSTNQTSNATVTADYNIVNPLAIDDAIPAVNPGVNAVINLLTNDKLSDGSPAQPNLVSVDLNPGQAGIQTTLVVDGQGTWTYNIATGELTFDPIPGFTTSPTPITYTLVENSTGATSTATVTVPYNVLMPMAMNDVIPTANAGTTVSFNLLTNDRLSDGSQALVTNSTIDLDPTTPAIENSFTVSGQGTWTYNPATGLVTFDPIPGYTIDPTPLSYRLIENATQQFSDATVSASFNAGDPTANDDTTPVATAPGANASINVLTNDLLSDGSPAQAGLVSVDLDPTTAGIQNTLIVPGQGTWTYNPLTGVLTFDPEPGFTINPSPITYTLIENYTGRQENATVTVLYNQADPVANNDTTEPTNPGFVASVILLTNDLLSDGSPATVGTTQVDLNPATVGIDLSFTVAGQGTWTYDPASGLIRFTPIPGFTVNPTPLTYRLYETATNRFDDAVVTAVYTVLPPDANDDSPFAPSQPGQTVSINVLANDFLSDNTLVTPGSVTVDLNPNAAGVQTTLVVAGQGTWTYNPATGVVTFTPEPGFTVNPTPISYVLTEIATGQTSTAIISATFEVRPPIAVNDVIPAVNPGSPSSINLLANDKLSDNSPATAGAVTVDLDPVTAGIQTTFTVAGEGTWTYNVATGVVTFTPVAGFTVTPTPLDYRLIENATGLSADANVRARYNELPPLAANDTAPTAAPGVNSSVNLLTNDKLSDGTPATLNKVTIDLDPATAGIQTTFTVAGQGTWTYNVATGVVTFDPLPGYTIAPTPLNYRLIENATELFSDATVTAPYSASAPVANNDAPPAVQPGATVTINILANDLLSDNSPVLPNLVTVDLDVDLDPNSPGIQQTLVIPGQGTWTYDPLTGILTFVPEPGAVLSPAPLVYALIENLTGLSNTASVTVTYNQVAPNAVNDVTTAVNPGTTASINLLTNDLLSDGSPATTNRVVVDLNPNTVDVETTLFVPGQGTWIYYPETGLIAFTPVAGFTIAPTPLNYRLTETATGLSDIATVSAVYNAVNPTASNDVTPVNNPGATATVNLLTNDLLSDNTFATPATVEVDLNPGLPGTQTNLVVSGQGTWSYNPATGQITFTPIVGFTVSPTPITYTLIERSTSLTSTATVTAPYNVLMPMAANDVIAAANPGTSISINLLTNDRISDGSQATTTNTTVDLDPSTPGIEATFIVPGEGTWTYNTATGLVTFTPQAGFTTDPTPLNYRLIENATQQFSDATVSGSYNRLNPIASNDTTPTLSTPGSPVIINLLANDLLSDNSPATFDKVTVDLDPNTAGIQNTLVVPGQGTFTYDPTTGQLTFTPEPGFTGDPTPLTYALVELSTGLTSTAVITVTVNDPPVAVNDTYSTDEDTPLVITAPGVKLNDTDSDTPANQLIVSLVSATTNGTITLNANGSFTYTPNANFNGTDQFTYTVSDGVSISNVATVTITVNAVDDILSLLPQVYLQGALFGVEGALMRDDLRVRGVLPTASPYASLNPTMGAQYESVSSPAVFDQSGTTNDIVDWVFVELRSATDPSQVVFSRSALLQRDGDIVDVNGVSAVQFVVSDPASYYVAISHRNHLSVMSATALPLSAATTTIDFRNASTPTWVEANSPLYQAQVVVDQGRAMWAGNALNDDRVVYQGTQNDVNVIYNQVITAPGNFFLLPNYILRGYFNGDIDMNGDVIFQGTMNDVEYIYQNVIKNHPGNQPPFSPVGPQPNFVIQEQLPE